MKTSTTSLNTKGNPIKITVFILLLLFTCVTQQKIHGQDSAKIYKNLKNTLKINLTNPMIFGDNCWIVEYERVIKKNQTASLGVGRFSLPTLIDLDTDSMENITKTDNSWGLNVHGDYRFYLGKLNKFGAPRGVYIGPYASYNGYKRDYTLSATTTAFTGDLGLDFSFQVYTVGFQLGYQFVFWNRLTLDLILFGPGIAYYDINATLGTTLDPDQEAELFQKLNEMLSEKIPGYSLTLNTGTFEKTGAVNTTSFGYRYVFMLGFRF
jgi:hypothetical protein